MYFDRISYVYTKFGNKLNVDILLATSLKNGIVENSNKVNSPDVILMVWKWGRNPRPFLLPRVEWELEENFPFIYRLYYLDKFQLFLF